MEKLKKVATMENTINDITLKRVSEQNLNSDVKNVITDMKKGLDLYMVLSD